MQQIRENVETMKSIIREMQQSFQSSSQKCEQINVFLVHIYPINPNWVTPLFR